VQIKKEGRSAVPASKFVNFVRSLPSGNVKIEDKNGKILVVCGKATLEEPGMNVEEFPALPELAASKSLEIGSGELADMIRGTSYAISRDETRPALMGILWEVKPDSLCLVATDAHRLARFERKMNWDVSHDRDFIVDTQGLHQFVRLAESSQQALVYMGDNQLSFQIGPTVLHTRLLEGPFPDYQAVLPQNNDKILTIDREQFSQAIRRVSITADRITSQIRLGIQSGSMELSSVGTDGSKAEDEIPVSYEGDSLEIGFNFNYLQDVLRNLSSENVQMLIKDPQSAALIAPVGDAEQEAGVLCLLMPLRLTSD
jgi:DNA polymerase-3 subunit beta